MSNERTNPDTLNTGDFYKPALPSGLNVLTILTFIGSGIQLLFTIFGFINARKNFEEKDKTMAQLNSAEMPGWLKSMMPNMDNYEELVTKSFENRVPIFILSLVALGLCIYGAMQMRKLKKQGFTFYLIGQLLPFVSSVLFIGFMAFEGLMVGIIIGITILFILLYAMNRKYLVY
jgi:hypothetical protein